MEIKDWVRAARNHNKKRSQAALGLLLGVSKQNISAWENGHHEPSFTQMERIAAITGYPLLRVDYQQSGWPMPMVDRVRYERLSAEDQSYVQAKAMAAIEQREEAAMQSAPAKRRRVAPAPAPVEFRNPQPASALAGNKKGKLT